MDKNLEAVIADYQQNKECARALKKLINENFDGYRLNSDKVLATAMNVFGDKRVELALASSIEQLSYDGRISTDNRNWAHGVMVAQDERSHDIRVDVHPGLIDTLTGDFRKLQKSLAERTQQQDKTVIDNDTAVGMAVAGFHVYMDGASEPVSREIFANADFSFDNPHTYAAPTFEVTQYGALEELCEKLDSLNDDIRADRGASLEDYAYELFQSEESAFVWRSEFSEWENIRAGILSGETKFLHDFLNDYAYGSELIEDLDLYETTYLKERQEKIDNKMPVQEVENKEPIITVSGQSGTNNSFDVTSVGFDTEKHYTVAEFNQALKKANEKWQENWDGLNYPSNIIIVTVENLHNEPCTYRVNLTDADYNSIQDIVNLSPIPIYASIPTEKAIEILNKAEVNAREQGIDTAEPDKTFAYKTGARSEPFTVIVLDIRSEERKEALSYALNSIINSEYYKVNDAQALPYKDLLKMVNSSDKFMHISQGHLSCLKYALREANDNELCAKMLDSIHHAENNITRENEYREPFQLGNELNEAIRATEKKVEHIPQPRDISHNTTNAALPAKRGESRGKIMEQNAMTTKFEMSSLSKLEGDGAKAIGTLVVNGEFAVHGVKVMEGKNGLYVSLPSEKRGGVWEETVFPVTKEARAAINGAVLDAYEKLAASPDKTMKTEIAAPEKPVSKIYAEMHKVESETTQTKAAGQITIDKCFVITGVKLNEGTNTEGQTKTFVAMPAKPNEKGGYDDVAHPITADIHAKVDKAVIASANSIGRYEYKGVKYTELGENPSQSKPLHPKFADKLMAKLDKAGITYQAKCAETVVISVKAADKQAFDAAQKDLTAKLNGKDKPKPKQTTGTQTQKR